MKVFVTIAICVSVVVVAATIARAIEIDRRARRNQKTALSPFYSLVIGVFIASLILFLPYYHGVYFASEQNAFLRVLKAFLLSVHNTMRNFILDGDFEPFAAATWTDLPIALYRVYSAWAAILAVLAPVLTAGIVLSFFKNITASFRYRYARADDVCVFAELSERSLAVAQSIVDRKTAPGERKRKMLLIFALPKAETDEEGDRDLLARALRLGALIMHSDVTELHLRPLRRFGARRFYLTSENTTQNVNQALLLTEQIRVYDDAAEKRWRAHHGDGPVPEKVRRLDNAETVFFVFATSPASEAIFDSAQKGNMKIFRVDIERDLALRALTENSLFAAAIPREGQDKLIRLAIVGMGGYGTELLSAACWIGQMTGYELEICCFDRKEDVAERVRARMPEIVGRSGVREEGESYCKLTVERWDIGGAAFFERMCEEDFSTVCVCLGDDDRNIEIAMALRSAFERRRVRSGGHIPMMLAVVYDSLKVATLTAGHGLCSRDKRPYDIRFVGDWSTIYSVDAIEYWDRDARPEERREECEYNRRSSIARNVHESFRRALGLDEAALGEHESNVLEHKRWNAYMRTEGYCLGAEKNALAKTHYDLIPYRDLTAEDKAKDKFRPAKGEKR